MTAREPGRGILLVLDGWGHAPDSEANALTRARTPTLDKLRASGTAALLAASGEAVGLLPGTVGNSEIGHLVIGAGRPLLYDSLLVQRQIDSGQLRDNELLAAACGRLAASYGALHLIGLCSDGQIHADIEHLSELLSIAAARGVPRVRIHAITDGRDVADGTAGAYLQRVQEMAAQAGIGDIATVTGRGYAMDKAGKLELTETAGLAIADGRAALVPDPRQALPGVKSDEWIPASAVTGTDGRASGTIADGDAILFFNFRSDRIQQLADFLAGHLANTGRNATLLSLAQYDTRTPIPALVTRADASGGLAHELERHGLRSVRIAEPEKFEHVTYYLNGRDDTKRPVEEHLRIDGGDPDYTARPQMRIAQVAAAVGEAVGREDVALVVANLANIDVVGHTGDFAATVQAAEHTDRAVAAILEGAAAAGRWALLVGDHGNAELMTKTGPDGNPRPYGGHTTSPVPAVIVPPPGQSYGPLTTSGGTLADIAPTVLTLLGRQPGAAMTGRALL